MIISCCIHFPENHMTVFFLKAENDLQCVYHIFLTHSSSVGYLCWLHNLGIDLPHILKEATEAWEKPNNLLQVSQSEAEIKLQT